MASNGLVANTSKTEFIILNAKDSNITTQIRVGSSMIEEVKCAKLLVLKVNNNQTWTSHFWGKG